jgi:hypothetical protein
MSLKITVEVDGQSEQQLAPLLALWAARHPEWLGQGIQQNAPELSASRDFYHENSALLQQQIQQLTAQNQLLQAQVSSSQRLLAGVPPARALPAYEPLARTTELTTELALNAQPPLLPQRYQPSRGAILRYWLKRPVQASAQRLGRIAAWIWLSKDWLALFLLLCGGMYAVLTIAPVISELWRPEFVESADGGPGTTKTTEPAAEHPPAKQAETTALPTSPSSKAGSHPPPPPAFQQQP